VASETKLPCGLTLTLFMARIFANDADDALAPNEFAFRTHAAYARTNLHYNTLK
jgi:hypothetical protein